MILNSSTQYDRKSTFALLYLKDMTKQDYHKLLTEKPENYYVKKLQAEYEKAIEILQQDIKDREKIAELHFQISENEEIQQEDTLRWEIKNKVNKIKQDYKMELENMEKHIDMIEEISNKRKKKHPILFWIQSIPFKCCSRKNKKVNKKNKQEMDINSI